VFFLNVPVGVAAAVLSFPLVPDLRPGRPHRFDLVGIGLVSAEEAKELHELETSAAAGRG